MKRNPLDELILDNPILIKHVRARLRKQTLLSALAVVGALELLILSWAAINGRLGDPTVFNLSVSLQGIILVIIGGTQVASAVGKVREAQILDFHRISPLHPFTTVIGFFLGAPILEYAMFGAVLPLTLAVGSKSFYGLGTAIQVSIAQLLVAWFLHAIALLTSLMSKKPKANVGGFVGLMFVFIMFIAPNFIGAFVAMGGRPTIWFFDRRWPWLPVVALNLVTALVFLMIASTRKMRSEGTHALSKPQALAFVGATGFLAGGLAWGRPDVYPWVMAFYVSAILAMTAAVAITPTAGEYARGLRRAERRGVARLSILDDLALNRIALGGVCLIVLAAVSLVANSAASPIMLRQFGNDHSPSLAIAVGVLTVAYFGLAYQFFTLVAPKRAGAILFLFLFFAWALPTLAGIVAVNTRQSPEVVATLMALGAPGGVAITSGAVPQRLGDAPSLAAILPPITFFFLFNNLISRARRKVERNVHAMGPGHSKPVPSPREADPFAVA